MARLLVIQHVPYETLGTFEAAFNRAGCAADSVLASDQIAGDWPSLDDFAGLVVMGGPQGVYEQKRHPYLGDEAALLKQAVKRKLPILGICLGAQLLAHALGAKVSPNTQKEIGWYPLMREPGADGDALFEPFGQTETVFQWHGDTFTLPKQAVLLASSPLCRNQAFRFGDFAWGLQFHLETDAALINKWLSHPANKPALDSLKGVIDPAAIKKQTPEHQERLRELAFHVASTFARRVSHAREKTPAAKR